MKKCTRCKELTDDFAAEPRNRDGLASWCHPCKRAYKREKWAEKAAPIKKAKSAKQLDQKTRRVKDCSKCKQEKPFTDFAKASKEPFGLQRWCRSCMSVSRNGLREQRKETPFVRSLFPKRCPCCDKTKEASEFGGSRRSIDGLQDYCRPCRAERKLLQRGASIKHGDFERLLKLQKGVCAICKQQDKKKSLSIDHSHMTGTVRGLLCNNCNRAIGWMADDPARMRAAAAYIEQALLVCHK